MRRTGKTGASDSLAGSELKVKEPAVWFVHLHTVCLQMLRGETRQPLELWQLTNL